MTAPKVIWVEPSIADSGTHGSTAWPDKDDDCIRYIRADAPELLALVDAVRELVSEAWGYGHLFDTQFHAHVHDVLHGKLEAYEALK